MDGKRTVYAVATIIVIRENFLESITLVMDMYM